MRPTLAGRPRARQGRSPRAQSYRRTAVRRQRRRATAARARAGRAPTDEQRRQPLEHRQARGVEQVDRVVDSSGRRPGGSASPRPPASPGVRRSPVVDAATAAAAAETARRALPASACAAGRRRLRRRRGSAAPSAPPPPSSSARQSANRPSSLLPTSAITPRPNCAGLPVIARSVVTVTSVDDPPSSCSSGGDRRRWPCPMPRASLPLASITARRAGLVLLDEPRRAGVGHLDRADLDLHPADDRLAVERLDRRAGHARRDAFDVEQHVPRLRDRHRHAELVLQLHPVSPPAAAAVTARVGEHPGEVLRGSRPCR